MAAIAIPSTRPWPGRGDGRVRSEAPSGRGIPTQARPALRPVAPCRPSAAVFRRRRLAALAVFLMVLALLVVGFQAVLGRFGGGPLTTTGGPGAVAPALRPVSVQVHIVQPGDTLWSIARGLSAGGDPRPIVDRLAAQRHGRPLQVGERILLP